MIALPSVVRASLFVSLAALASACYVSSESDRYNRGSTGSAVPPNPSSAPSTGGTSTPSSTTPILVTVDNDKTMTAAPGDGVGILTEYGTGGHWHVWWTCDTAQTQQPCTFDLQIVAQGAATIGKLTTEGLLVGDSAEQSGTQTLRTHAYSTNDVGGVRFDTEPGSVVQIEAKVGGVSDPSFFFFVQDGRVNGGYGGKLSNPLRFQGTTP